MARPTIILSRSDVNSELYPYLFAQWLEELGIDPEAESITLCLSSLDCNEKIQE
jgi:hypothetical protein